jgi:hypothetical protein
MRRARKLRERLRGGTSPLDPVPPKPHGMWRRTYERLTAQLNAVEGVVLVEMFVLWQQFEGR